MKKKSGRIRFIICILLIICNICGLLYFKSSEAKLMFFFNIIYVLCLLYIDNKNK